MADPTPGTWSVIENRDNHWGMIEVDGPSVQVRGFRQATDVSFAQGLKKEADARLIAAAPELLAELRHVLSAYVLPERKTCGEAAADGERIKALIAKATGDGA